MDTPFPVRFLNISALGDWMKISYFRQYIHLWCFSQKHLIGVMSIVTNFTSTKDYSWLWYNKYQNVEILVLIYLSLYLNSQYLEGIKFRDFHDSWPFSLNFVLTKSFKTTKLRNQISAKLNTCRVSDSLFPKVG